MRLKELGGEKVTLVFEDLGLQLSRRLVYLIEYLGPLVIFPLLFYCPEQIYGQSADRTRTQ
jgi:very-long-chain enoyl-CoA reductase